MKTIRYQYHLPSVRPSVRPNVRPSVRPPERPGRTPKRFEVVFSDGTEEAIPRYKLETQNRKRVVVVPTHRTLRLVHQAAPPATDDGLGGQGGGSAAGAGGKKKKGKRGGGAGPGGGAGGSGGGTGDLLQLTMAGLSKTVAPDVFAALCGRIRDLQVGR